MVSDRFSKILIVIISAMLCLSVSRTHNEEKEDNKLVLNTVELIDLINEERKRTNKDLPTIEYPQKTPNLFDSKYTTRTSITLDTYSTESKDKKPLKTRKVWSRWSKWGECSVTCGAGTIKRCRVCVEGHCAPGEREEQRRPCCRAPCHAPHVPIDLASDDLHYIE